MISTRSDGQSSVGTAINVRRWGQVAERRGCKTEELGWRGREKETGEHVLDD